MSIKLDNSNVTDYGNGTCEIKGSHLGYDITIWDRENDTRLFVSSNNYQVYAHRVDDIKDGIDRGIKIATEWFNKNNEINEAINADVESENSTDEDWIEIKDRQTEFNEAVIRGFDFDLDVFAGFDNDTFFVNNGTSETEYKIELKGSKARCECKDFQYRKRICKHIASVMNEIFSNVSKEVK